MGVAFNVRELIRWANDYYLWAIGAITATLALFGMLRQMFPKAATVVAIPFRALGWVCQAPIKALLWVWRQAWLQRITTGPTPVWVYRGPITRAIEPRRIARRHEIASIVAEVVSPKLDESHQRSLKMQEIQTVQFQTFNERLGVIEKNVTDETRRRFDKLEGRIRDLEDAVTLPTKPGRKATTEGDR